MMHGIIRDLEQQQQEAPDILQIMQKAVEIDVNMFRNRDDRWFYCSNQLYADDEHVHFSFSRKN